MGLIIEPLNRKDGTPMLLRRKCTVLLMALAGFSAAIAQEANPECVRQGKSLFAEKKYKDAVRVLEKCGNDPSAWELLGLAYFELSYMDDAKSYLKKAIERDPGNLKLKNAYADAFAYNREFKKAVVCSNATGRRVSSLRAGKMIES